MKINYDAEVDILTIIFNDSPIESSDEDDRGIIFDYDLEGKIVSIEILDASKQITTEIPLASMLLPAS